MGILDIANSNSIWRGYDYFERNMVTTCKKIGDNMLEGVVKGSNGEKYQVTVDIQHAKRSTCTCPHAEGTRRACKYKVALYLTVFPEEAKRLVEEAEAYEAEQQEIYEDIEDAILKYLHKCKKDELIDIVYDLIMSGPDWQFDRFMRDNLDL